MKYNITVPAVIQDFQRRDIAPDDIIVTPSGNLERWRLCQSYIGAVRNGDVTVYADSEYSNTVSPAAMAADIMAIITPVELAMVQSL